MKTIQLGKWIDGGNFQIDIAKLLASRALIQANSGGGKSWALRRLLEITAGHVQQLIIDPEGEFASLREKHDLLVISASGGDALAHPKTAKLLAIRLLETHASAVLDLYELKSHERHQFVKIFLDALMNAPKSLWHPVLVVIDEIQMFCPEKGQGESEATEGVIDVATRGRKRGFALIGATLRIGKVNKSAVAELKNKLIGSTGLDIDVKRAAFELGLSPKEAMAVLRPLQAGHFFAFGPAFNQIDPREMIVGQVETTHPKPGSHKVTAPPPPTAAIKALMPQLADLPREAEEEARTVDELKRENTKLKREIRDLQNNGASPSPAQIDMAKRQGFDQAAKELAGIDRINTGKAIATFQDISKQMLKAAAELQREGMPLTYTVHPQGVKLSHATEKAIGEMATKARETIRHQNPVTRNSTSDLPKGEAAVLSACIQFPNGLRREQLTVLTAYKRSSRDAYIQRLREKGYVDVSGDVVVATDDGIAALPDAEPLPTGEALQEYWLERLPEGERKILGVLIAEYPKPVERPELDAQTGYQRSSRDAYLQRLGAKQLVEFVGRGEVKASQELF